MSEKIKTARKPKVVGVQIVLLEPRRLAGAVRDPGFVLFEGQPVNGLGESDINKALCAGTARAIPVLE
jgi:hypothetical protein